MSTIPTAPATPVKTSITAAGIHAAETMAMILITGIIVAICQYISMNGTINLTIIGLIAASQALLIIPGFGLTYIKTLITQFKLPNETSVQQQQDQQNLLSVIQDVDTFAGYLATALVKRIPGASASTGIGITFSATPQIVKSDPTPIQLPDNIQIATEDAPLDATAPRPAVTLASTATSASPSK